MAEVPLEDIGWRRHEGVYHGVVGCAFRVGGESLVYRCWLREEPDEGLDNEFGYGTEGISAVLWSLEGKPSSLEPIWRYV
jgi:hypothetical protein